MPKLIILVGPPGSGKSTYAKTLTDFTYINQDSQGKEGHWYAFVLAVTNRKDIVVDRMNFNREQRARYITLAKNVGYSIEINIFHRPKQRCIESCISRIGHETIKDEATARKAINFFFSKYEKPGHDEGFILRHGHIPKENERFPQTVIVDLDGTLCNINHRLHHVRGPNKKNWPAFFAGIKDDKINLWCENIIRGLRQNDVRVVFCSSRGEEYREPTQKWLDDRGMYGHELFMRPAGDSRPDDQIKETILDFDILTQFSPLFFIDDRQRVVDMWRYRGFTCLQCAEGDF